MSDGGGLPAPLLAGDEVKGLGARAEDVELDGPGEVEVHHRHHLAGALPFDAPRGPPVAAVGECEEEHEDAYQFKIGYCYSTLWIFSSAEVILYFLGPLVPPHKCF